MFVLNLTKPRMTLADYVDIFLVQFKLTTFSMALIVGFV